MSSVVVSTAKIVRMSKPLHFLTEFSGRAAPMGAAAAPGTAPRCVCRDSRTRCDLMRSLMVVNADCSLLFVEFCNGFCCRSGMVRPDISGNCKFVFVSIKFSFTVAGGYKKAVPPFPLLTPTNKVQGRINDTLRGYRTASCRVLRDVCLFLLAPQR